MQTCSCKVSALSVRDGRTDVSHQASIAEFVEDAIADGNNGAAASMEIPYGLVDRSYQHFVVRLGGNLSSQSEKGGNLSSHVILSARLLFSKRTINKRVCCVAFACWSSEIRCLLLQFVVFQNCIYWFWEDGALMVGLFPAGVRSIPKHLSNL